jgi:hypothetical protein
VEPTDVEDVRDLSEFATAHLLELRHDDALLDRALHASTTNSSRAAARSRTS